MFFKYDPINSFYKSTVGAVEISCPFTLRVETDAASVSLMLKKEGKCENVVEYPMIREGGAFCLTITITTTGLYRYCFVADGQTFYADERLNAAFCGEKWTLTAFEKKYDAPEWLYGGVIYQIFPDRFAVGGKRKKTKSDMIYRDDWVALPFYKPNDKGIVENRDLFGGNLQGIIDKLDYLKSLGVTCIYLNPVFESFSNHKYDTANYALIDSDFGTTKELALLVEKAEKQGIRVILDGVFSHTGSDSVYFNKNRRYGNDGAYNNPNSMYSEWYKFDDYPDSYECWWGINTLPNVDENSYSFNNYINGEDGIIRRYMNVGIAGWRLDVADELPERFLENLASAAKKAKPDALILGEVWENAATKYSYGEQRHYFCGSQLDSVTNYPLRNAILDFVNTGNADKIDGVVRTILNDYPLRVTNALMNFIGTHDTPRALALMGRFSDLSSKESRSNAEILNYDEAAQKLRQATVLQYFLPGVPSVYYGDEAGMYGFEDPFNRRCYPWGKEDENLVSFYKTLGKIRKEYAEALKTGSYERLSAQDGVFCFLRKGEGAALEIIVNASDEDVTYECEKIDLITQKKIGIIKKGSCAVFEI